MGDGLTIRASASRHPHRYNAAENKARVAEKRGLTNPRVGRAPHRWRLAVQPPDRSLPCGRRSWI
ncbi:hypothetical protein CW304_33040 [Bacillus sp. UFRGS-B20]|nr:hypothetical protein CW304_33040 [Bacillus sp. UFRGS-B20]